MDFTQVATNLGVPVAILAALGLALWRVLKWLGLNVVKPVADRHIVFLDSLETNTKVQTQTLQAMGQRFNQVDQRLDQVDQRLDQVGEDLADIKGVVVPPNACKSSGCGPPQSPQA